MAIICGKEKRIYKRKQFEKLFYFETIETEFDQIKHIKKSGFSVDISEGGLGIKLQEALMEGEILKIFFPISEINISIPIFAEVMWIGEEGKNFRIGLRFLQ